MDQQPAYVNGFERRDFRVLGHTLAPLTLGHAQLLLIAGSPIVGPGDSLSLNDLGPIISICTFPMWEQARDVVMQHRPENIAQALSSLVSDDDLTAALNTVAEYAAYYLAAPRANRPAKDALDVAIPWPWAYAEFLQAELHRTEAEAWATICSDAFAYFAAHSVRHGDDKIYTPRQIHFIDHADEIEELFNKQRAGKS